MKMKKTISSVCLTSLFIILLIFMPKLIFQQIRTEDSAATKFSPGKIVIRFSKEVSPVIPIQVAGIMQTGIGPVDVVCQNLKVHTMRRLFPSPKYATPDLTRYFVVKFDESFDLDEAVTLFSQIPFIVEKAEKVARLEFFGSNDPNYGDQWHLEQVNDCDIDAPEAWNIQTGDDSVILAIPDSGVKYDHPDLDNNIWINEDEYYGTPNYDDDGNGYVDDIRGWNWGSGDSKDPMDTYGHGTHVAGIAAAETNNEAGVAGIAGGWYPGQTGCRIMCLRLGHTTFDMDDAAESFIYATDKEATAINCSWQSEYTEYFKDAIDYALYNGVLIVAAAGNDNGNFCNDSDEYYLSMVPGVLVIAATDQYDQRAIFDGGAASNYGPCIDVSAPGKNIMT
jgi:subtilisin family serine protease